MSSSLVLKPKDKGLVQQLREAAGWSDLSYHVSSLHPEFPVMRIMHPVTKSLYNEFQDQIKVIYDDERNPTLGVILFSKENELIITFHGINFASKDDHIASLKTSLIERPYFVGTFHEGFLKAFERILPKIRYEYRRLQDFHLIKKTIIGHSKGAALAQLFTLYFHEEEKDWNTQTFLFGSPKCMCPKAAERYQQLNQDKTYRLELARDIITHMPMNFMGYTHVGRKINLPLIPVKDRYSNHSITGYLQSLDILYETSLRIEGAHFSNSPIHTGEKEKSPFPATNKIIHRGSPFYDFMRIMGHRLASSIQHIIRIFPRD